MVLSIANYLWLAFLDVALLALHPLFFATPIRLGGMGMSPATIGLCLGIFGLMDGIAHGLFFPKVIQRVGLKKLFLTSVFCFIPMFAMFPVVNHFAREWGLSPAVWGLIMFHFVISSATEMAFGGCSLLRCVDVVHTTPVSSPQVARSYISPPPWRTRGYLGVCMGSDKPVPHSLERWALRWQHLSSHSRWRIIGWVGSAFTSS